MISEKLGQRRNWNLTQFQCCYWRFRRLFYLFLWLLFCGLLFNLLLFYNLLLFLFLLFTLFFAWGTLLIRLVLWCFKSFSINWCYPTTRFIIIVSLFWRYPHFLHILCIFLILFLFFISFWFLVDFYFFLILWIIIALLFDRFVLDWQILWKLLFQLINLCQIILQIFIQIIHFLKLINNLNDSFFIFLHFFPGCLTIEISSGSNCSFFLLVYLILLQCHT